MSWISKSCVNSNNEGMKGTDSRGEGSGGEDQSMLRRALQQGERMNQLSGRKPAGCSLDRTRSRLRSESTISLSPKLASTFLDPQDHQPCDD